MSTFELVWDSGCGVGESPVWDAAHRRVLFADIPGKRVLAYGVDDGTRSGWDLPDVVASFGLARSGRLVVALRDRVVLFDPVSGGLTELTGTMALPATNRLNDGKVGPDGAFWVGGIDLGSPRQPTASLYRVTPDGRVETRAAGYAGSNGLAWSPDGRTMYHSDSTASFIEAWDFDPATGDMRAHRVVVKVSAEVGRPDGAAVDADGNYWSAAPSVGHVNCFSPAGTLLRTVDFPVTGPTMPCFAAGGLFVTSLREGKPAEVLAAQPTLGGLFRMAAPVAGAPVGVFAD
ncbi:MAG: SMP-30/gluconolactonase/LRE family protein [Acetobacteraceae bacterium]|nr:SMP-30/gluconolactonase/LRE family protein [Acetobacteraceae bacterium]